jgi:S1-C subfamily serine protease
MVWERPRLDEVREVRAVRGSSNLSAIALLLLTSVTVALGLLVWKYYVPRPTLDPDAKPRAVEARGDLAADERSTIAIYERASPSVVFIRNLAIAEDPNSLDPYQVVAGSASGFVWDDAGHVVTNYHVIHGSREIEVWLTNHERHPATVVGYEVEKDVAVLHIDAERDTLRPIAVGTSADLQVGQKVFAIGNPFGLDQTLTSGIISGLGREMLSEYQEEGRGQHPITDLIQTDAAINKGNSGGPLLDSAGRLIGMNAAIYSPTGVYSGVGFAIPVDTIQRVVTQILRSGQASRPGLGVQIASDRWSQRFRVDGVLVAGVKSGTGAARAGLRGQPITLSTRDPTQTCDVIVGVNGVAVHTANDLYREIDRHSVGDKVKLAIQRDGRRQDVEVELQDMNEAATR